MLVGLFHPQKHSNKPGWILHPYRHLEDFVRILDNDGVEITVEVYEIEAENTCMFSYAWKKSLDVIKIWKYKHLKRLVKVC